jgi:hypothetical protein
MKQIIDEGLINRFTPAAFRAIGSAREEERNGSLRIVS